MVSLFSLSVFFNLVLVVLNVRPIRGHGSLIKPLPTFTGDKTNFITAVDGSKWLPGYKAYDGWSDVDQNADSFNELLASSSKFNSLKDIIDSEVPGCGNTDANGERRSVVGLSEIEFQNVGNKAEGLTRSHSGPCEVFIDEELVFQNDNCAASFTASPAVMPVDFSSCTGDCLLTFYWVGLQEQAVQIYKNCVPISGGGGGNNNDGEQDNNGNGQESRDDNNNGNEQPNGDQDNNGNGQPNGDQDNNGNEQPNGDQDNNGNGQPNGDQDSNGNGQPNGDQDNNGNGQPSGDQDDNGNGQPDGDEGSSVPEITKPTNGNGGNGQQKGNTGKKARRAGRRARTRERWSQRGNLRGTGDPVAMD